MDVSGRKEKETAKNGIMRKPLARERLERMAMIHRGRVGGGCPSERKSGGQEVLLNDTEQPRSTLTKNELTVQVALN